MDYVDQARQLEHKIQSLQTSIGRLERHRAELLQRSREVRLQLQEAQRERSYLRLASWLRSPQQQLDLWPVGVLLIGPTAVAGAIFLGVHLATDMYATPLLCGGVAAVAAAMALALLLFYPRNDVISKRMHEDEDRIQSLRVQLARTRNDLDSVNRQLGQKKAELTSTRSSVLLPRRRLLQCDWRSLRGIAFEEYLAQVCSAHGARVEHTKSSGDQGVDLIAVFNDRRVAIQAKGWSGSVGNSAVQEVVTGQRFYGCTSCAVITNSRFTSAAVQLAAANNCTLISEENFDKFVMGDISL